MRSQLFGTPTNRVKVLEDLIQQYSQAYYDGSPLVSDQAFDQLVAELRGLDSLHPLLRTTSTGYKNPFTHLQKVKHPFHVGSLDKLKWEEIQAGRRWPVDVKIVASVKVDGGSGTAHYDENGWLIRVLSRGDGEEGLDITQNVVSIPRRIPATGRKEVIRGELVITWEDFEGMDGASHPRNSAVGISQSNASNDLRLVRFVAYTIYDFEGTKLEMLQTLETLKFEVVPYTVFEGFDDFTKAVRVGAYDITQENQMKDGHHIPCDGTVLTENANPENQIAIKFEDEVGVSSVLNIEWSTSRTGRVVPVAIIEPLNLSGAIIRRVNCSNVSWLKEMRIRPGCKVEVIRANCIIPYIRRVVD